MSTKAQVKANRKNSKKSTGPRSPKGKAAVAKNAIKHGLFASEAVIRWEDPEEFEHFREELLAELGPVGHIECILAERAVGLAWRLQRVERMQNQAIDHAIERKVTNPLPKSIRFLDCNAQEIPLTDPRRTTGHLPLGRIANSDWPVCRMLERLSLYERRMESSLFKTLAELERRRLIRELKQGEGEDHPAEPSPSPRDETATRRAQEKAYLKKRSQLGAQPSVSAGMKRYCENRWRRERLEYEAKQSQFKAGAPIKAAARREELPGTLAH